MYDTCLMFGASQAVGIFHRLSNALVRVIEKYTAPGCVINYLDDFLIVAPTKESVSFMLYEHCPGSYWLPGL